MNKYILIIALGMLAFITTSFVSIVMIVLIIFVPNTLANIFLEDSNYQTKQIDLSFATFI